MRVRRTDLTSFGTLPLSVSSVPGLVQSSHRHHSRRRTRIAPTCRGALRSYMQALAYGRNLGRCVSSNSSNPRHMHSTTDQNTHTMTDDLSPFPPIARPSCLQGYLDYKKPEISKRSVSVSYLGGPIKKPSENAQCPFLIFARKSQTFPRTLGVRFLIIKKRETPKTLCFLCRTFLIVEVPL